MKKVTILLACLLTVALAIPAFAVHEESDQNLKLDDATGFYFELSQIRYRFNHYFQAIEGTDDSAEYLDDDFDTKFTFARGDITAYFELEIADNTMGDDTAQPDGSWNEVLGAYGGKWTPESLADSGFSLEVGDFGTGFGKNVNNDDSPRGSLEVAFDAASASIVLGYGRVGEWGTTDDVEGDSHLVRGQVNVPLGESGFSVGAYVAMYSGSDTVIQEAADASLGTLDPVGQTVEVIPSVPQVLGDVSVFLGSVNFSGAVGGADIFAEAGFATGTQDSAVDDAAVEGDLSGFYALGGANFAVGQITLGVEAAFGSGDDPGTADENEGFLGVNNDFGYDLVLEDNLEANGLTNKIYGKLIAKLSPTEKVTLEGDLIYTVAVEDFVSPHTGETADTYGFEVDVKVDYVIADYLTYVLNAGFLSPDESYIDETQYSVMNRLEFSF